MNRVLYFLKGEKPTAAVVENGRLCEYIVEAEEQATERILLGRVVRIVPALKAAFVNIGQERDGFLPLQENSQSSSLSVLTPGQQVLVQIKKEARDNKGAFLTRDISLCGQYVILMPMNRYIGISARIQGEEDRARLSAFGKTLSGGDFGIVSRTAALNVPVERLEEEVQSLLSQWKEIQGRQAALSAPSLVYQPRSLYQRVLDDYLPIGVDQVFASPGLSFQLPAGVQRTDVSALHEQYKKELSTAQTRFVWLKNGGALYIDEGEAFSMIDVNTAKMTKGKGYQEAALQMNLEAIPEIVRQIRLRNLSGILLIDFIDLADDQQRSCVQDSLAQALLVDRAKTVIHGFTSLGLMELTRKRTRNSLRETTTAVCSHCHGSGRIPIDQEVFHG